MKTSKRILPFSSADLVTTFPESWEEVSQQLLRYIYTLLAEGITPGEVRTYAFCRHNGIKIAGAVPGSPSQSPTWIVIFQGRRFALPTHLLAYGLQQLDWIEKPPTTPVRLDTLHHATAIDTALHGLPFKSYIQLENLFQGYLMSKNEDALTEMAKILYPGFEGNKLSGAEQYNIVAWMSGVKSLFARLWPDFFQPAPGAQTGDIDMVAIMNAEIRALTGGDITKEPVVLESDCWRALTELNEKTREARELQKSIKK